MPQILGKIFLNSCMTFPQKKMDDSEIMFIFAPSKRKQTT